MLQAKTSQAYSKITSKIEHVTPLMAREMLSKNTNNRNINAGTVRYYIEQIKRGNWDLNGESIKISEKGTLLDGQHRLEAISRSGFGIDTFVIRGLSEECFTTIDAGKVRNHADYLKIAGHNGDLTTLAAAARVAMSFNMDGVFSKDKTKVSPDDVVVYVEKHPGVAVSCSALSQKIGQILPKSLAIGCHYIFSIIDSDKADYFFHAMTSGEGLKEGNPILTVRNRLIAMRGDNRAGSAHRRMVVYYLVHAWNNFMKGREIKNIAYKVEYEIKIDDFKNSVLSNWR